MTLPALTMLAAQVLGSSCHPQIRGRSRRELRLQGSSLPLGRLLASGNPKVRCTDQAPVNPIVPRLEGTSYIRRTWPPCCAAASLLWPLRCRATLWHRPERRHARGRRLARQLLRHRPPPCSLPLRRPASSACCPSSYGPWRRLALAAAAREQQRQQAASGGQQQPPSVAACSSCRSRRAPSRPRR